MQRAVIFFEPDEALKDGVRPLALESVQGQPVLYWMARALCADGVRRFFLAAPPRYGAEIRACFPPDAAVDVSDRHDALMEFLSSPDMTAVLSRAALPFPQVGAGFAYAAPAASLADTWRVRMTNAVQDAVLLPGWVPLYGRATLDELQSVFQPVPLS